MVLYFLAIAAVALPRSESLKESVSHLGEEISEILKNTLGTDVLTAHLDSLEFADSTKSASELAAELAVATGARYAGYSDAAELFTDLCVVPGDTLEQVNAAGDMSLIDEDMVEVDPGSLKYSPLFEAAVDLSGVCSRTPDHSVQVTPVPKSFIGAVVTSFAKTPSLKYQYIGREDGSFLQWPATISACTGYDPRFRPWYTAAQAKSKAVVILVDSSREELSRAKLAARTVVATLGPNDLLAVVEISDGVAYTDQRGSVCERSQLIWATSAVKDASSEFIASIGSRRSPRPKSGSQPRWPTCAAASGIAFADNLISATDVATLGERPIAYVLFTSGTQCGNGGEDMSGSTDLAEALANHNKYLRRAAVLVFDLGIGHSVDNMADIVALRTLAASTSGVYSSLPDESNIYAKLAEYYSFSGFKRDIGEGVVVSPPYYDAFGLGIIVTLATPLYSSVGSLMGVVAVDVALQDLLSTSWGTAPSRTVHTFLVEQGTGLAVAHPRMTPPTALRQDPALVNVRLLEPTPEFAACVGEFADCIYGRMAAKSALPGSRTVRAVLRAFRRGGDVRDGYIFEGDDAADDEGHSTAGGVYAWEPVPGARWTAGVVVVGSAETRRVLSPGPSGAVFSAVHLELSCAPPAAKDVFDDAVWSANCTSAGWIDEYRSTNVSRPAEMCLVNSAGVGTLASSSIAFAPFAWRQPIAEYPTHSKIREIEHAMVKGDETFLGELFALPILSDAGFSEVMESFWKETHGSAPGVFWRYVGTAGGVFRTYPGAAFPADFDHTVRPWYLRAMAFPGQPVISTPYEDAGGLGTLMTISKSIPKPGGSATSAGDVAAVMGIDVSIDVIRALLESVPRCAAGSTDHCILIDAGGRVAVDSNGCTSGGLPLWLLQKLLDARVLSSRRCNVYSTQDINTFYEFELPGAVASAELARLGVSVTAVGVTNLVLLIMPGRKLAVPPDRLPFDGLPGPEKLAAPGCCGCVVRETAVNPHVPCPAVPRPIVGVAPPNVSTLFEWYQDGRVLERSRGGRGCFGSPAVGLGPGGGPTLCRTTAAVSCPVGFIGPRCDLPDPALWKLTGTGTVVVSVPGVLSSQDAAAVQVEAALRFEGPSVAADDVRLSMGWRNRPGGNGPAGEVTAVVKLRAASKGAIVMAAAAVYRGPIALPNAGVVAVVSIVAEEHDEWMTTVTPSRIRVSGAIPTKNASNRGTLGSNLTSEYDPVVAESGKGDVAIIVTLSIIGALIIAWLGTRIHKSEVDSALNSSNNDTAMVLAKVKDTPNDTSISEETAESEYGQIGSSFRLTVSAESVVKSGTTGADVTSEVDIAAMLETTSFSAPPRTLLSVVESWA